MTTLDTGKRPFFAIYKPGQGKYVRWGTVIAVGLFTVFGIIWVDQQFLQGLFAVDQGNWVARGIGMAVAALLGAAVAFLAANRPRTAEFMIMTESEMRKVTWPSRQTVINSTKVVIVMTLLLALILWVIDAGFMHIFGWMGIL